MHTLQWHRLGAISTASLVLLMALQPLTLAQAQPLPANTARGCNDNLLLLPTHADVVALGQLYERYLNQTPEIDLELGLSRQEFAQNLFALVEGLKNLKPQGTQPQLSTVDTTLLKRLQRDYAGELKNASQPSSPFSTNTVFQGALATGQNIQRSKLKPSQGVPSPTVKGRPVAAPPLPPSVLPKPAPPPIFALGDDQPSEPEPEHSPVPFNTEDYSRILENPFQLPTANPLSTFSIDVDTASYSNVRRFIRQGQLPPKDAVRIEELINYFPYDYPQPAANQPFSVSTEMATAPWNNKHQLVQIGLKGKQVTEQASNLVFLIDVSGSMQSPNKLALVKKSLCALVHQLKPEDRVSLVVYAGQAGVVLPPTLGSQKARIMAAIDRLEAGGSTAGGAGIQLAYSMAARYFLKDGNNRVILATDGDFNVGQSSDAELERLIEQKRDQGIFLTVLGYGTGNYKDNKLELLADKGNGNYAYLDTWLEAQKVLVNDLRGTLFTIAKDVKIQVEFNPAKVQAYRLIGYENRLLRDQDFNDDRKDAGEIGSGHTVTALYEIIPTGITSDVKLPSVDPLKFQKPQPLSSAAQGDDLMQVKLRYKQPLGNTSQLITESVPSRVTPITTASKNLQFAAAVAMYGMVLRDSEFKGAANFDRVLTLASQGQGNDAQGYRQAFIQLVQKSAKLKPDQPQKQ